MAIPLNALALFLCIDSHTNYVCIYLRMPNFKKCGWLWWLFLKISSCTCWPQKVLLGRHVRHSCSQLFNSKGNKCEFFSSHEWLDCMSIVAFCKLLYHVFTNRVAKHYFKPEAIIIFFCFPYPSFQTLYLEADSDNFRRFALIFVLRCFYLLLIVSSGSHICLIPVIF
jgi:hypothetical protein